MENHKEKLAIFDSYAKEKGYLDFEDLIKEFEAYKTRKLFLKAILNATDLVQQEALKRASENAKMIAVHNGKSRDILVDKQSILNEENKVK